MRVVVGRVLRAHGLRGDVLVDVRTDEPKRRFARGSTLQRDDADGFLTVESAAAHGDRMRVKFAEVADRTAAEAVRGVTLEVDTDDLPRGGDPDDFHDAELIGLAVVTPSGSRVGTVVDVQHPAQDLLVVEREGGDEVYVPFVSALVPSVDLAAGTVVVDPPPGLFDDAAE